MKKPHRRPVRFKGLSVGIDLHKQFLQYSVLSPEGEELASDRAGSRPEVLEKLLDDWCQGLPGGWESAIGEGKSKGKSKGTSEGGGLGVQVSLEASGCFMWAYDLLVARLGRERVHVAAPSKVRVIADSMEKNDENDAWWLAYLLWEGRLPEALVAEGDLRELRIASRELRSVVDERSDLKRRMKSHLAQLGLGFSASAWASDTGRVAIAALVAEVEASHGVRGGAGRIDRAAVAADRGDRRGSRPLAGAGRGFGRSVQGGEDSSGSDAGDGHATGGVGVVGVGRSIALPGGQELRQGDGPDARLPRIGRSAEQSEDYADGFGACALGLDAVGVVLHALHAGPGWPGGAALGGACLSADAQKGGDGGRGPEDGRGGLAALHPGRGL